MAQQTIMAIVTHVSEVMHVTDKFSKLEIIALEIRQDGKTNTLKFQAANQMANTMNGIGAGSTIQITFDIEGREWTKDGKTTIFMNLNVVSYKILTPAKPAEVPVSTLAKDINTDDYFNPDDDDDGDLPF